MSEAASLLADIRSQPQSWQDVLDHQTGAGRTAIADAAERIRASRHVVLSGMGASHFACAALHCRLAEMGLPTYLIDTAELLHHHHRAFGEGTVVVLVTRSGETVEAVKVLPLLRESGAKIVAITNVPGSTVAREADCVILIGSPPDHLGVAIQTYTCTLLALHVLGTAVLKGRPEAEAASEVPAMIRTAGAAIERMIEDGRRWAGFLKEASAVHLLARGASMASTMEGAILFNEIAKLPAVPMGASLFRHGPVEAVDRGFRAIVFAPAATTRDLDLALISDLAALGVETRWIGPRAGAPDAIQPLCMPTPQVPPALAPIVEILPTQVAALSLAESRGIPVGQFRIAGSVTLSETGFQSGSGALR